MPDRTVETDTQRQGAARHPSGPVSDRELFDTVARMEARLRVDASRGVAELLAKYQDLANRFERDLSHSPREVALAKASALMLIQEVAREERAR